MQSVRIRTVAHRALGALLASAIALAAATQAGAAAGTQDKAQLQQQLDAARGRLDDAARDVADLSRKLYGDDFEGAPMPAPGGPPRGAMLGINIGGSPDLAEGVAVMGVSPSGPAAAAGLKTGDVIVAIDGKPLRKTGDRTAGRQLVEQMRGTQPGQKVKVDYLRDGRKLSTTVTTVAAEPPMVRVLREHMPMLEGMPIPPDWEEMINPRGRGFRALELVPITPRLGQYFGTDHGLLVVKAPPVQGPGLEEGDVIFSIGGRTPESPRHAFRILGSYQPKEQVKVEVLRHRKRLTLDIQVPDADAMNPGFRPGPPPRAPAPPALPAAPADAKGSGISS
ncbi:MAG: PDZ domain-containing protein [Gammaproteobacteria bacterium]|nr:PDZ domain-containing protein [Gammaproteobacteria bacterium]